MRRILTIVILLVLVTGVYAEDRRSLQHGDRLGFDYYDAAWSYLGQSRANHLGSYDFFDRTGHKVGWADGTKPGRVDFFLANGQLLRSVVIDATGGSLNLDAYGNIKVIGSSNIRGGVDYYSPFTLNVTSATTSLEYVEFSELRDDD
jgi:hypothetical protein